MNLLFLVVTFPLLGFLTLALSRTRISENAAAAIGVGSIGLSALLTAIIGWQFYQLPGGESYTQVLWTWMNVDGFALSFELHLDPLSQLMMRSEERRVGKEWCNPCGFRWMPYH